MIADTLSYALTWPEAAVVIASLAAGCFCLWILLR